MFKLIEKLLKREQKMINAPFIETYPKVSKSVVPEDIPYEEWRDGKWATTERKSIIETLKENK